MSNNNDPVTLDKYAYGNMDPVNHISPTEKFSLGFLSAGMQTADMNRIKSQFTDPFRFVLYAEMIGKGYKPIPAVVDGAPNLSVAH